MAQPGQVGMPLVVDVDGTLIKSDLLIESALKLIKQSPLSILWMLRWLLGGGKARLKSRIAERVELDIGHLPFRDEKLTLSFRSMRGVLVAIDKVFERREVYLSVTTDEAGIPRHLALPEK